MATPHEGLARLRGAAACGDLDALAARHRVRMLTAFGSTARGEANPRDLDIGVLFERGSPADLLALITDHDALTGSDNDVAHLNRAGRASLTQEEAAQRMHVTQPSVSPVERGDLGRAGLDTIRAYVEALGGKVDIVASFGDQRIVLG